MTYTIEVVPHAALTAHDIKTVGRLFDDEYVDQFGPWNPELPYGYAPHDVHVIARSAGDLIGHVGWQRRVIAVGDSEVTIAGVGGVLISVRARGHGMGRRLMRELAASLPTTDGIEFGYLGCREEVVEFYRSCGWLRINAVERSVGRDGRTRTYDADQPMLILPVGRDASSWPDGTVDLRGRAW